MKAVVAAIPHPDFPSLFLHFMRQDSQKWTTPGGKCDNGEDPVQGVLREAEEEVGVSQDQFEIPELVNTTINHYPDGNSTEVLLYILRPKGPIKFNLRHDPDQEGQPGTAVFLDPITTEKPLQHPQSKNILVDWLANQAAQYAEHHPKDQALIKGQNGDWQKEGYTLHHEISPGQLGLKHVKVTAKDKKGQQVGFMGAVQNWPKSGSAKPGRTMTASLVRVEGEHQRKGLASAMYQHAEKMSKLKMRPDSGAQSEAGEALWSQKKRPFGKAEEPLVKALPKAAFPPNAGDKTLPDNPEAAKRQELRLAPNLADAKHSARGFNHSGAQRSLHHGVDLSSLTRLGEGFSEENGLVAGTGKNAEGHKIVVKQALPQNDAALFMDPTGLQHYPKFNTAHREALYHSLAQNVFGLGHHVPTTSVFETSHNGNKSHFSAQKYVDDAELPTMDDYGPESAHAKNGTLHKLALMDAITGNYDRHGGNYLVSKDKNPDGSGKQLHLIDNGLAFAHGAEGANHLGASYGALVADEKFHPEARKWLHSIKPEHLEAEMRRHSTPEPITERTVNSLRHAQNADKATNGEASLTSHVESLYNAHRKQ